jgi:hypothetical protein
MQPFDIFLPIFVSKKVKELLGMPALGWVNKLKKSRQIEKIPDSEIPEKVRKGKHYLQKSFYRIPQF